MKKKFLSLLLIATFMFCIQPVVDAKTFELQLINDVNKPWSISFNTKVDYSQVTRDAISIKSETGEIIPITYSISDDLTKIIVKPSKPYKFGTTYTLQIGKKVASSKGNKLLTDVTKQFKLQGTYIADISNTTNPWVKNIKVQVTSKVSSVKVSINNSQEVDLNQSSHLEYERGFQGLTSGDDITIRVYNNLGNLIETQLYVLK